LLVEVFNVQLKPFIRINNLLGHNSYQEMNFKYWRKIGIVMPYGLRIEIWYYENDCQTQATSYLVGTLCTSLS